ncbi:MAG: helix-turn-helix transcriptional regulator [Eubacterium sp.]|nr:helix-turn-helix transcriptional regulator [Eubacterium sp.]
MIDFYEQLKRICQEHHTSIYAVEKATGGSKGSFIKWRTSSPSAEKLIEVADYLGVSMDYLIGRVVPRKNKPSIIERPEKNIIALGTLIDDPRYVEITKVYAGAPNDEAKSFLKGNFVETAKQYGIDTVPLIGY